MDFPFGADFDLQGFWWLPGEEDAALPGTLQYRQGELLVLEVIGTGSLGTSDSQRGGPLSKFDLIVGRGKDGTLCSFLNITQINRRINSQG